MQNKVTLYIMNRNNASMKKLSLSAPVTYLVMLVVLAVVSGISYLFYDYYHLKNSTLNVEKLEKEVSNQVAEINIQEKQIQNFKKKMDSLKVKLTDINNFEKKIRVMANMENSNQTGLFGVGGAIDDELETTAPLVKKHNTLLREMHDKIETINDEAVHKRNAFNNLAGYLEDQRNLMASTPSLRPADGWVKSKFGYNISPVAGVKEFNKGIDIANKKGTSVIATADGIITYADFREFSGKLISIDHGHGLVSTYGHLSKLYVKLGDNVKCGDIIGEIGNTGMSKDFYVHYEIHLNGLPVNPAQYILN